MPNMTVPVDGRRQFSFADVAVANASLGRMPWAGVEQVGPDRYVVANSWPTPRPTPRPTPTNSGFSSLTASQAPPEAAPKSSAAARAIWPNLR
jgi:hypothetical protein